MFEKIVVATDLSRASDRLISWLQGLRPFGAREAILVHALGIRHLEAMKYELARLVEPGSLSKKRNSKLMASRPMPESRLGRRRSKLIGSLKLKGHLLWWSARTEERSLLRCPWEAAHTP
jgi:hypothetical protein